VTKRPNIKCTLGETRSHLTTKGEVLDHFAYCLEVIKQWVRVDELFGREFQSDQEIDGKVQIICQSVDGPQLVVEAKRLTKP
jgi:hypothetical protein